MGTSRAIAKQVPVVGCLPGPISIFFVEARDREVHGKSVKRPPAGPQM